MLRRTVLALALVVGLTPAWAADAPAQPDRAKVRAEVHARLAARLATLDPQFAKANATDTDARLVRGADFDKDGVEEVVDVRMKGTEDATTGDWTETMRFDVRRGRDGSLLWSKEVGSGSFVFPLFTQVGANGGMGVVVVEYDTTGVDAVAAGVYLDDTRVTAFDGKGTEVWTASYPATNAFSEAGGGSMTFVEGLFNANPGGGSEVLLTTTPFGYVYDPLYVTDGASAATVTPVILDGATGQPRALTPVATTSPIAFASPVSDLNKDGRDDVVVSGTLGTVSTAVALRSSDGVALWANRDLPSSQYSIPFNVGDVTGDGVDVSVSTSAATAGPLPEYKGAKVSLVNGATGALVWSKPGMSGAPLGDADRKPGAELAVSEYLMGSSEVGFSVVLYNAAGTALWKAKRTVSNKGEEMSMGMTSWGPIGDTGTDGVAEIGYSVKVIGMKAAAREDAGTIDGRTGKVRKDPVTGMYATRLTLDGRGTDGYMIETKKNVAYVTGYRGDNDRKLWRVALPVNGDVATSATPLFAGRDKCGDLAIRVQNGATVTHIVLSGATGKPLWALARTGDGTGKVTKAKVRTSNVYARSC